MQTLTYNPELPFAAICYRPKLRGKARDWASHYEGHRVVRMGDGGKVAEVIYDDGGLSTGTTERSEGYRSLRLAERIAEHRNFLHRHQRSRRGKRFLAELRARIAAEANVELQRELIDRYGGLDRYMADCGAERIHSDATGALWRHATAAEAIVAVEVTDPSTGRVYMLRVPPRTVTARAAVAWTFGMTEAEYLPTAEA